jgi:hypothetical protein
MKRQRRRPETYEAEVKGKKVRVTVPENDESGLFDAIREQISPHAVAAIVSYLQPVSTRNSAVNKEVAWFSEQLVELLGGYEQQTRLANELGL